jgi:hypothetical protein
MWIAQFVCAPQFFKTPKGPYGHTVLVAAFKFTVYLRELRKTSKMSVRIADPGPISHYLVEMKVNTTKKFI